MNEIRVASLRREVIRNEQYGAVREPRLGVMLHYDESSSDASAVAWFKHPECRVSYHFLVLDDGSFVEIAPLDRAAYHAGECRPSSSKFEYGHANSAFYGVSIATNTQTSATVPSVLTMTALVRELFVREGWSLLETWRITGHSDEAWPRGRRIDPEGRDKARPIVPIQDVRTMLAYTEFFEPPLPEPGERRWSSFFQEHLVLTRYVNDAEWYFVRESEPDTTPVRAQARWSEMSKAL